MGVVQGGMGEDGGVRRISSITMNRYRIALLHDEKAKSIHVEYPNYVGAMLNSGAGHLAQP